MTESLTLSVAEVASALGISERLVYALIERGDLPAITFGRRKVVPTKAVDLLLEHALEGFDPSSLARTLGVAAGSASADEPRLVVPATSAGDGSVASGASSARGAGPTGTTGTDAAPVSHESRPALAVARSSAPVASSSSP